MSRPGDDRLAISNCTTLHASTLDDITLYREAGASGIGIWEPKLDRIDIDDVRRRLDAEGMTATYCFPTVKSPLPGDAFDRLLGSTFDIGERVRAIVRSLHRLAELDPLAVCLVPGPAGDLPLSEAHGIVVDALGTVIDEARRIGVPVALEMMDPQGVPWPARTVEDVRAILDAAGGGDAGILVDTWHVRNEPEFAAEAAANIERIAGVQVSERRPGSTAGMDRLMPGRGEARSASVLADLLRAGYDGWFEVEVFSDDGTFGNLCADSYWSRDPAEVAVEAVTSLRRALDDAHELTRSG